MSDHVRYLAEKMSLGVRRRRLERDGYSQREIDGPHIAFDDLPDEEQQTWLDCAAAAAELFGTKGGAAELLVQDDDDALAALAAVLAWASEKPQAVAEGDSTGTTYQRGRVLVTATHDGTIGVSTYETALDATAKIVEIERGYREWLRSVGKQPRDEGNNRRVEKALGIHEDFGGLIGAWIDDEHAFVARVGHGRIQEAMQLTPLNALQLRRNVDELIRRGKTDGRITEEHEQQSSELPPMPAAEYDPDYTPRT